jgi:hypothetical protein
MFYPDNKVVIIDDNSNHNFVTSHAVTNTMFVKGEFPARGELLPYLHFLKERFFDTAVMLHDSTFVNRWIDFSTDEYKILWSFEHWWDKVDEEGELIRLGNDPILTDFYHKQKWVGCFGAMAVITHDYLVKINSNFKLALLVPHVTSRAKRICFERVIATLLQFYSSKDDQPVLFGDIIVYNTYGITFDQKEANAHLPITKVWTGR